MKTRRFFYLPMVMLLFMALSANGKTENTLKIKLDSIARKYHGNIGVAVCGLENGEMTEVNNNHHYPMLSVFKFPLALYVLHQVDQHKITLEQKIHVSKGDLYKTWSPLKDKYPDGNIDITVAELLDYTVSKSDNNTCDILFRLIKGTKPVNQYIHNAGINNIAIASTELQMGEAWEVQYTNWAEPSALAKLLKDFYAGKLLSKSSTALLMQLMVESQNSPNRLKGLLPAGTIVAHKTGTSNTNDKGMTTAVNDIGIVTLPGGQHFAIAVFVSNTTESKETGEKIIAEIGKVAYDHFNSKNK